MNYEYSYMMRRGPFHLRYVETIGNRPYAVTTKLLSLLDMPVEDREDSFRADVINALADFNEARAEVWLTLSDHDGEHVYWDRHSNIWYNMNCELCTLDEAIASYLRSLPTVFFGSMSNAFLFVTRDEGTQAKTAFDRLMRRIGALYANYHGKLGASVEPAQ